MKSILISTQPKWVEKICKEIYKRADGTPVYEKEIEVRKTKPKLETPFKCYIYQTKESRRRFFYHRFNSAINGKSHYTEMGKVIGEFICDRIEDFSKWEYDYPALLRHIDLLAGTKNDFQFIDNYLKGQKKGYGWHISNLKIYDKPKELREFYHACKQPKGTDCSKCIDENKRNCCSITRPPQSWCYVEEL